MQPTAVFFNIPGYGHINPSLPLADALVSRSHRIAYFTTEKYRKAVETTGAEVHLYPQIEDDYFERRGLHGGRAHRVALQLLQTTEAVLPHLLKTTVKLDPDYVLYDGMCPWGYFVARILGLPAVVSLALMPPIAPPPRALLNRTILEFIGPAVFRDFRTGLAAIRLARQLAKQYGIEPLGLTRLLNAPGDLLVSYTSAEFQPFSETVPDTVRFVGRTVRLEAGVAPRLFAPAAGRPLVYVSLGTLHNRDRDLYARIIRAFAGRDEYVLLTTGRTFGQEAFPDLPENVAVHPWLPQAAVLERAALFITHGGLNSIHDGLFFGVPMLLLPQQGEQGFNSARVTELEAGIMLRGKAANRAGIAAATQQLLAEPAYRQNAARIGATFRKPGSLPAVVDEIESMV